MFTNKKGQTGVERLYPFILLLILVGLLIGIGLLTYDKFSASVYYTREDYNDTVTRPNNLSLTALDYGNVTMGNVYNGTVYNLINSNCYAVNTTPGQIEFRNVTAACHELGNTWYAIYDFKEYDTKTKSVMDSSGTETAKITTDWLGLIITVMVLAIILFLVIRSFGFGAIER